MMTALFQETLTVNASSFEVKNLFPTPLIIAPINQAEALNKALTDVILSHAEKTPGVLRSNAGGWQSKDDFVEWSGLPGSCLLRIVRELANQVTGLQTETGISRQAPEWRMNAWANINKPNDANHAHHHPSAFWSGVYWVDAGKGDDNEPVHGEFELQDPRGILPAFYAPTLRYALPGCLSAGQSDFLVPESGTLILFPAWLVHAVRPYHGTSRRISIAFNFSI